MAKSIAEIPFQIIFPAIYLAIVYYVTEQVPDWWRFLLVLYICILLSFIAQSVGLIVSAIFVESFDTTVFAAAMSLVPVILFAGFFIRIHSMPYLQFLTYFSYLRFAFESVLIAVYGFNRCGDIHHNETTGLFILPSG